MPKLLYAFLFLLLLASCKPKPAPQAVITKPQRQLTQYFDSTYLLYKLADNFYKDQQLGQSFKADKPNLQMPDSVNISFQPLGYDPTFNLQYTHVYSSKCVYHIHDSMYKYAEVCFPNTCLTNDLAHAQVKLHNSSSTTKTIQLRLFYQNTSYWYATVDSADPKSKTYLDNYYGASNIESVTIPAGGDATAKLTYRIGLDPKGEFPEGADKGTARPGNYEFMLLASTDSTNSLLKNNLDLIKTNPFMAVRNTKGVSESANIAYVGPHHFKFVFLDEYFDGVNDLDKNHVYIAKHGKEKKLCDTCTGWYKEVISEDWTIDDFFKGYISKAPIVKAEYGIRRENTQIDSNGITITIPASTKGNYKKTWGEVLFGPSFKYGHVTIHAKLAPMFGSKGLVNGIIHNLWLYERDPDPVDKSNPYHYLDNGKGKQPYEIDFEVWSSTMGVNTMWDDNAFIYYSIVDYMRNPKVKIKPGDVKDIGKYTVDRRLPRQAGIPGKNLPPDFFKSFHYFDLYWYPDHVRYLIDGEEVAVITKDMASIPDKYMFLWMGSPLYQDGTYYAQYCIPFLKEDKHTYIDYLRIE